MSLDLLAHDMDDAVVYREWDNIDLLIELPSLKLIVAIENKVGSKAGEGQLERYDQHLRNTKPDFKRLMVFLTPDSTDPDHEEYVAFDYRDIVATLQRLITDEIEPVPAESGLIIQHYIDMVRRHIVQDDHLTGLARSLYEKHREAFDFIYDCRPAPDSLLTNVRHRVEAIQGLKIDSANSTLFRFYPEIWETELKRIKGDPNQWSRTGRGMLFEVKVYPNAPGRVNVSLLLGPGETSVREKVYRVALEKPKIYQRITKPMGAKWSAIFSLDLLTAQIGKKLTFEQQENNVGLAWSKFQGESLQALIDDVIRIDKEIAETELGGAEFLTFTTK